MNREELAWAAGLFEGEGCITISKIPSTKKSLQQYPRITVGSLDRDVIRRFHQIVGVGTVIDTANRTGGTFYIWRTNSFEACQAVIAMLWHHLRERRRIRAVEVLTIAKKCQSLRKRMKQIGSCQSDNCNKMAKSRGWCGAHDQEMRRRERAGV